jgi:hypothetical protein
MQHST